MSQERPFCFRWMFASMAIFIAMELLLGGFVGGFLLGNSPSIHLKFLLQGLLNLVSYFIGGLIIGAISPGLRLSEPAWGAFCSVTLMLVMTFFTPFSFMVFSVSKMIIGGFVAFFLALSGAKLGERLTGNKV